jgi:hypothetical protein
MGAGRGESQWMSERWGLHRADAQKRERCRALGGSQGVTRKLAEVGGSRVCQAKGWQEQTDGSGLEDVHQVAGLGLEQAEGEED